MTTMRMMDLPTTGVSIGCGDRVSQRERESDRVCQKRR